MQKTRLAQNMIRKLSNSKPIPNLRLHSVETTEIKYYIIERSGEECLN